MPNTNTTFFLSDSGDTLCPFTGTATDTAFLEIGYPVNGLSYAKISARPDLMWELAYTVIFMIVFAFVRLKGKDLLFNLVHVLVKRKKAEIMLNEGISSNLVCYVLALCLSLSIISGCISFVVHDSFLTVHTLYYFGGLSLFHFLLLMLVHLLGWTFNDKNTAHEIIANIWAFHITAGLLVSPFVISLFFVKSFAVIPLIKIVTFGFGFLMIVKNIRWLQILFIHKVPILYMILYLCTLEIMPVLVLYKVVA